MRLDNLSVSRFYGAQAPLLDATQLFKQGDELLPVRVASLGGSQTNPTLTITGLAVRKGRPVSLTVSARDTSTVFPTPVVLTFKAGGVTFATRTHSPVSRDRFFTMSFAGGFIAAGSAFTVEGQTAVRDLTVSRNGLQRLLTGRFDAATCPYSFTIPTGGSLTGTISGYVFGSGATVTVRRTSDGTTVNTASPQMQATVERWALELVHAYVPTADGTVNLEVSFPGTWLNPALVARQ